MYLIENPVLQRELLVNLRDAAGVRAAVGLRGLAGRRRVTWPGPNGRST